MSKGAWAREDRSGLATIYARQLLHEVNIESIPIDPFLVGARLGVAVREEHYDGVEGYILRVGDVAGIGINRSIEYEPRRRFTMGHELAHYYLPWHANPSYMCSAGDLSDWHQKAAEREANEFAAELMMPLAHFQADVDRLSPSLATFRELAETKYATSLVATAIRFTKLTLEPIALVLSNAGKVLWMIPSPSFPYRAEECVTFLSENSYAWDFFHGKELPDRPKQVLLTAWFATRRARIDSFVLEESTAMPRLGLVFTVITVPPGGDVDETNEVD